MNAPQELIEAFAGSGACTGDTEPFNDIRDLLGNVAEWGGSCDGQGVDCATFGVRGSGSDESCAATSGRTYLRETSEDVGFRCCADPVVE